jgi:glycosyltransferase involved in cell wall biosynthesis
MLLGGAARSLDLLVRGLDPSRYECVIACIHPVPEVMDFHAAAGVRVVPSPGIGVFPHTTGGWLRFWNPRHLLTLFRALARYPGWVRATERLISEVGPDMVHLNSAVLSPAADGARRAGVPFVWHIRESVVKGYFGIRRRWLSRKIHDLPDAAVFLSRDDMRQLGSSPTWHVIPNWTSFRLPPVARSEARRKLEIAPESRVILFLGGFSGIKGASVLLKAMQSISEEIPDALCIMAGVTPPSHRLRARLARKVLPLIGVSSDHQKCEALLQRVRERVITLPFLEDTADLFAAADVMTFPATEPHFPRPVIEAFAHRVPVVASDIGPLNDLLRGGRRGVLVPPGDPVALARGLVRALTGSDEIRAVAERAFEEGRSEFSPEAGAAAIEAIYQQVLARGIK